VLRRFGEQTEEGVYGLADLVVESVCGRNGEETVE